MSQILAVPSCISFGFACPRPYESLADEGVFVKDFWRGFLPVVFDWLVFEYTNYSIVYFDWLVFEYINYSIVHARRHVRSHLQNHQHERKIVCANIIVNRAIAHAKQELRCCSCNTSDCHVVYSQLSYILFYPKRDI